MMSYYKLSAISRAAGVLRNHRKTRRRRSNVRQPYARRKQLTTCYGFKIVCGELLLPCTQRQPIHIPLNSHTLDVLSEGGIAIRSITLTPNTLAISYSRKIAQAKSNGLVGLDSNLDNVTAADSCGFSKHYDLSRITEVRSKYREVEAHLVRHDIRIRRQIFEKYGMRERNRVQQILTISRSIL